MQKKITNTVPINQPDVLEDDRVDVFSKWVWNQFLKTLTKYHTKIKRWNQLSKATPYRAFSFSHLNFLLFIFIKIHCKFKFHPNLCKGSLKFKAGAMSLLPMKLFLLYPIIQCRYPVIWYLLVAGSNDYSLFP